MWSRDGNLDNRHGSLFEPNHFVPLLKRRYDDFDSDDDVFLTIPDSTFLEQETIPQNGCLLDGDPAFVSSNTIDLLSGLNITLSKEEYQWWQAELTTQEETYPEAKSREHSFLETSMKDPGEQSQHVKGNTQEEEGNESKPVEDNIQTQDTLMDEQTKPERDQSQIVTGFETTKSTVSNAEENARQVENAEIGLPKNDDGHHSEKPEGKLQEKTDLTSKSEETLQVQETVTELPKRAEREQSQNEDKDIRGAIYPESKPEDGFQTQDILTEIQTQNEEKQSDWQDKSIREVTGHGSKQEEDNCQAGDNIPDIPEREGFPSQKVQANMREAVVLGSKPEEGNDKVDVSLTENVKKGPEKSKEKTKKVTDSRSKSQDKFQEGVIEKQKTEEKQSQKSKEQSKETNNTGSKPGAPIHSDLETGFSSGDDLPLAVFKYKSDAHSAKTSQIEKSKKPLNIKSQLKKTGKVTTPYSKAKSAHLDVFKRKQARAIKRGKISKSMDSKEKASKYVKLNNKKAKPFIRTTYVKKPPPGKQQYSNLDNKKKVTNNKIPKSTDSKEKISTSEDIKQTAGAISSASAPSTKTQKQYKCDDKEKATKDKNVGPLENKEKGAASDNLKRNTEKPGAFSSAKVLPAETQKQCKAEEKAKATNNIELLPENGRYEEPRTTNQNENTMRKVEDPYPEDKPASDLSFSNTLKKSPKQKDNQSDKAIDNLKKIIQHAPKTGC